MPEIGLLLGVLRSLEGHSTRHRKEGVLSGSLRFADWYAYPYLAFAAARTALPSRE